MGCEQCQVKHLCFYEAIGFATKAGHLATEVNLRGILQLKLFFARIVSAYFSGYTSAYVYLRKKLRMWERHSKETNIEKREATIS